MFEYVLWGAFANPNDGQPGRERERTTPATGVMPGYYTTFRITLL